MRKPTKKEVFLLGGTGLISGIINGFFGAGSGLILVPLIKIIYKLDEKQTHATTLACVLFSCLLSAGVYIVKKQVDWSLVLWCLIGSIIGGVIGTVCLKKLKNDVINLLFSLVLICAGVFMIVL
ncbi:MAG: sulfite exporter TauE/SafE family protein [Clostridia bacterium]|nr:sulfite exporter TauE/SafE family protein [Clostridia bacterium]